MTQLFAEALVLSVTAALVGLTIAALALAKLQELVELREGELPFWVDLGLSPAVITYALVRDFEAGDYEPSGRIYLPADVARLSPPISLAIRERVDPVISFAPQIREIAAAVDPMLQLVGLVSATRRPRGGGA